jgi:tetratricopeptide (TPR) repeat protein
MRKILFLSLSAFLVTASYSPAFAAGGGGNEPAPPAPSEPSAQPASQEVKKCKDGEVLKKVKRLGFWFKKCVPIEQGFLSDDELYEQGRQLAKAGEYQKALTVLAAIKNQNDPHVLNYTGYSHRKSGRLEIGITYYRKALAIDPNFVLAREYLGEGYVSAGRIDLAQIELNEIKARAGANSEEYKDLAKVIETATN